MSSRFRYSRSRRRWPTSISRPRREAWSFLWSFRCSVSSEIRLLSTAIWTSVEPVSVSPRPCSATISAFCSFVRDMVADRLPGRTRRRPSSPEHRVPGRLDEGREQPPLEPALGRDRHLRDRGRRAGGGEVRPDEVAEAPEDRSPPVPLHRLETVGVVPEDDVGARVHHAVPEGHLEVPRPGVELD